MSLSDPAYIGFFTAVFNLFYLIPGGTVRLLLLLAASLGFYFNLAGVYVSVLLFVAAIAYIGGLLLQRLAGSSYRRLIFIAVLLAALAPLMMFKYLGFICDAAGAAVPDWIAGLALPVGLSFFTFAAVGYLID